MVAVLPSDKPATLEARAVTDAVGVGLPGEGRSILLSRADNHLGRSYATSLAVTPQVNGLAPTARMLERPPPLPKQPRFRPRRFLTFPA
jgi:hypothetical protein